MSNRPAKKIFYLNGTWTAPAGVTRVLVQTKRRPPLGIAIIGQAVHLRDPDGFVYGIGAQAFGELGVSDVTPRSSPTAVVGAVNFAKLAEYNGARLGLDNNGSAFGWGINTDGALGTGNQTTISSPIAVVGSVKFSDIFSGPTSAGATTLALSKSGALFGWGINNAGQLGHGDVLARSSPIAVLGGLTFQTVAHGLGGLSIVALTKTGLLYGWGNNSSGQLGLGDVTARSSPIAVAGGLTFAGVKAASWEGFCMGITQAGALYAWGINGKGALGDGTSTAAKSSPVAVLGGLAFVDFKIGMANSSYWIGLTAAGVAYACGDNSRGQLGDGTTVSKSSPVAVLGSLTFAKIFVAAQGDADSSVFGITTAGALYAWGGNLRGQLGDGTIVAKSSPVAVLGSLTWSAVVAVTTPASTYGVTTAGVLYSWGLNTNGQLGLGDVTPRSSPVAVVGGLGFSCGDEIKDYWITVVPGTAYAIYFGYMPSFGNIQLGKESVDSVEIQYG